MIARLSDLVIESLQRSRCFQSPDDPIAQWPNRSELPAVLLRPAFDDNFLVGIKLNRVPALSVKIAEEAVFPSAEREIGHGRGDSDVDANIACGRFIAKTSRCCSARGEERSLIAIGAAFEKGQRLVHIVRMDQAEHRSKYFGISDLAGRRHIIKNRRVHEIARFVFWNFRVTSIEQNFGALLLTDADERLDTLLALRCNHGPHLNARFKAVTHAEFRGRFGNRVAKSLLRFANRDRNRNSEAALPGAPEGAVADYLRRHRHVGVRKHDDMILRSALALAALSLLRRARIDITRDRSRSHETDGSHFRVVDQSVDYGFGSID